MRSFEEKIALMKYESRWFRLKAEQALCRRHKIKKNKYGKRS
jgi:hypothetical protein